MQNDESLGLPASSAAARSARFLYIDLMAAVVVTGFAVSVAIHYWLAGYDGAPYAWNTYLFRLDDTMNVPWVGVSKYHCFGDFYACYLQAEDLNPYHSPLIWFASNYFPFGAILVYPFTFLKYSAALYVYLLGFLAFLAVFNWRYISGRGIVRDYLPVFALTCLTYPVHYLLDRGNIEGLIFMLLAMTLWLWAQKKFTAAAVLLGAAAATKGYPLLFILLFMHARRYREALIAMLSAGAFTFCSAAIMKGGIISTAHGLHAGLRNYNQTMLSAYGFGRGCSWYGMVFSLNLRLTRSPLLHGLGVVMLKFHIVFVLLFMAVLIFLIWRLRIKEWELVTVIALAISLLPNVTADYRQVHLFFALAAFIRAEVAPPRGLAFSWLFALLLIPKGYPLINEYAGYGVILNPLLMLTICVTIFVQAARRPDGTGRSLSLSPVTDESLGKAPLGVVT